MSIFYLDIINTYIIPYTQTYTYAHTHMNTITSYQMNTCHELQS